MEIIYKAIFKLGRAEQNSSTIGFPAGIETTPLRRRCTTLIIEVRWQLTRAIKRNSIYRWYNACKQVEGKSVMTLWHYVLTSSGNRTNVDIIRIVPQNAHFLNVLVDFAFNSVTDQSSV